MKNITVMLVVRLILALGLGGVLAIGGLIIFLMGNQLEMTATESYIKGSVCFIVGLANMVVGYFFHRQTMSARDILALTSPDSDNSTVPNSVKDISMAEFLATLKKGE